MSDNVYVRKNCRLCHSQNLKVVLPLAASPLPDVYIPKKCLDRKQDVYPMDLYLCKDCGFSQLNHIIQAEDIYTNYLYETKSSLGLVAHFKQYAHEIADRFDFAKDALAVDIGSNDGTLLRFFKNQGLRILGVDPAQEIARQATESGVETLAKLFDSSLAQTMRDKYGPASIVTINNLFANVDDLDEMVKGVRLLLDEDGIFIFESFYLVDLIDNMVFDFIYHEHISCFTVKPLQAFFRRHGMELFDVQRIPTKGGSLRYFVKLTSGKHPVTSQVSDLIQLESDKGVHDENLFQNFSSKITALKHQSVDMLKDLKAQGKIIAGYGASATTTTMLHHFELKGLIDYIIDDNPTRQGLYSPAMHIPIVGADIIAEKNIEYIFVFAWRYIDSIIKKNQTFLDGGGKFIVPLPEMKIIESSQSKVSQV